jgi:hypothetical protein
MRRTFLIRTLRIVEDRTPTRCTISSQGCRQRCFVDRLVRVEDEGLGEQAIALTRRHCVERRDRAGQEVARHSAQRSERRRFQRIRCCLSRRNRRAMCIRGRREQLGTRARSASFVACIRG